MDKVQQFYDELSNEYSELIAKCVPRYPELIHNMFQYLPEDFNPKRILDRLEKAEFPVTDILYKYLMWAVIWARK
ncbi:MAG: hypothetical protein WKF68_14135 [Daejeonella sp.]